MKASANAHDWHCEDHDTYGWRGEACRLCPEAPDEQWAATLFPFEAKTLTRKEIFQAGAASRDVEIAELVGVLGNVTAHLIAAHSLLSSGGKKAVASDTIFKIMLQDYEKSFEAGRKALAKVRKP